MSNISDKEIMNLHEECLLKYLINPLELFYTTELLRINNELLEKEGVNITCETAPHYLVLTDMDLREHGRFKMNPPIRAKEDREELIRGIKDGTIDLIITDHAPHSEEEK